MEKSAQDESVQKAYSDLDNQRKKMQIDEAAEKLRARAREQEEKLRGAAGALNEQGTGMFSKIKELRDQATGKVGDVMGNEAMKPVADASAKAAEGVTFVSQTVLGSVAKGTSKVATFFEDKEKARKFWDEQAAHGAANGAANGAAHPEAQ